MSVRGQQYTLLAATTPATSATALTAFQAYGNSVTLQITTVTGGAGTLTLNLRSSNDGTTYYKVLDLDSEAEWTSTDINTAGTYELEIPGSFIPNQYYQFYYACTTGAGTIAINAISWENPAGDFRFNVGDIHQDIASVEVSTDVIDDWDATHGSAVPTDGCMSMAEAKTIDGSALPNAVSEGQAVRPAAEKTGNLLVSTVSQDGSYIQPTGDAVARSIYTAIGDATTTAVVETAGTKKALNVNVTDGTNDMPTMDANTRAGFVTITDGTTDATVDATTAGLDVNLEGVAGTATNVNGGNRDAGTQTVTLADDDPAVVSLALLDDAIKTDDDTFTPATDKVMVAGFEYDDTAPDSVDEGDAGAARMSANRNVYTNIRSGNGDEYGATVDDHGCLWTLPQLSAVMDDCNSTSGWSVLSDDTDNLTTATNHVYGTASLSFDKVDGAGNTIFAGIQRTISSTDVDPYLEHSNGFFLGSMYISSLSDVAYAWFRAGTDSSNYNEWRVDDDNLVAGQWTALRGNLAAPYVSVGNGWDSSAVTWMAVGLAFDAQDDTLANILVDHLAVNSGLQVSADLAASDINTPNINLHRVGGQPTDTGTGNVGNATIRATIADDDTNLAAIKTAIEIMDDWDESDRCKINPIAGQAGIAANAGAMDALTTRVTLAIDDTQYGAVGAASDVDGNIHGQLRYIGEAVGGVASTVDRDVTNATGTGSGSLATTSLSQAADLKSVTVKLDGALAAGETFTVTLDASDGAAYDADLRVYDMGTAGTTSWNWIPEVPIPLENGDEVSVSLSANTNNRTYGLRIVADKV